MRSRFSNLHTPRPFVLAMCRVGSDPMAGSAGQCVRPSLSDTFTSTECHSHTTRQTSQTREQWTSYSGRRSIPWQSARRCSLRGGRSSSRGPCTPSSTAWSATTMCSGVCLSPSLPHTSCTEEPRVHWRQRNAGAAVVDEGEATPAGSGGSSLDATRPLTLRQGLLPQGQLQQAGQAKGRRVCEHGSRTSSRNGGQTRPSLLPNAAAARTRR